MTTSSDLNPHNSSDGASSHGATYLGEVGLPESITAPVRALNEAVLREALTPEGAVSDAAPRTALVLQRSAELPALSTKAMFADHPALSGHTRFLHTAVGKVLAVLFGEAKGYDEPDVDLYGQRAEFEEWLKTTPAPPIQGLLQELAMLGDRTHWPVLVLDDAQASGEAVEETLPAVLAAATGIEVPFVSKCYYSGNFRWEEALVDALEVARTPAESQVLEEVLKGSVDARRLKDEIDSGFYDHNDPVVADGAEILDSLHEAGESLLTLDTELAIELCGVQAQKFVQSCRMPEYSSREAMEADIAYNPGRRLLDRFGLPGLLAVRAKVQEAFASIR